MTLLLHHVDHLRASGLTDATIATAGIYSVTDPAEVARILNWQGSSGPAPALAFPIIGHDGAIVQTVLRPDQPRAREDGSVAKYEQPVGERHHVWFPPPTLPLHNRLSDSSEPLVLTEGVKKALAAIQAGAAALSMQGVSTWHDAAYRDAHRGEPGQWKLHPDLMALPLRGRPIYVAFDGGDTTENTPVILAEARLARLLLDSGADAGLLRIPFAPGGPKVGLDDFLAKQADPTLALAGLQANAITADPLRCARGLRKAPRDRQAALAQALLSSPAFLAALHVGGKVVLDLVQKELYQTAGLTKGAIRGAVEQFRLSLGTRAHPGASGDGATQVSTIPYEAGPEGTVWFKMTKDGPVRIQLANFSARIASDVTEDDGVETRRNFDIEGTLHGRARRFQVSSQRFRACDWAVENLGAEAVIAPGFGARERLPVAVQLLSGQIPLRTVYSHTGWRQLGDGWGYLHGGGAIGPNGPLRDVEVALPAPLRGYILPEPPIGSELVGAVRASLGMLAVAPDRVTFPLYAAIWRALLGPADFSLHFSGQTGEGKSELAALAQQHWGPGLNARNLPGSWTSTGNALESLSSVVADAVFTVDDFCPAGSSYDVQKLNATADRLLRGAGNGSGRARMRADTSLRPPRPPRGLMVSTGEETPLGQSLRARIFCIEVGPGDVQWARLTLCQEDAAGGRFAAALAAFIQWLACGRDALLESAKGEIAKLRLRATEAGTAHRRTPEIVANLYFGFETFLSFAVEAGVFSKTEADQILSRCWHALGEAAADQASVQAEAEPTQRFLGLLASALASGRAHVASCQGTEPQISSALGWRGGQPMGKRVGWTEGADLFLERDAALAAANEVGQANGSPLLLSAPALAKRLNDKGLLLAKDTGRNRLQVRVTLDGARRTVLHLPTSSLTSTEPAQPAQSGNGASDGPPHDPPGPEDGPPIWAPRPTECSSENGGMKENGPIGPLSNGTGRDQAETQPDDCPRGPEQPAEAAQQRAQFGPVTPDEAPAPAEDSGVDL